MTIYGKDLKAFCSLHLFTYRSKTDFTMKEFLHGFYIVVYLTTYIGKYILTVATKPNDIKLALLSVSQYHRSELQLTGETDSYRVLTSSQLRNSYSELILSNVINFRGALTTLQGKHTRYVDYYSQNFRFSESSV